MRRRLLPLLVLFALAVPALARVVSYAPYTNRIARAGYHLRTTRWFPLLEGDWLVDPRQQLVLYDSSGAEEPRVIFPKNNEPASLVYAAWFERETRETSFALVAVRVGGAIAVHLSRDGGNTWSPVANLGGFEIFDEQIDRGGPWVHGMSGQVRIGNAEWPFVVQHDRHVRAISATGGVKSLAETNANVVGQNRAGTKYLIELPGGIWLVDLNGGKNLVRANHNQAGVTGWVADDDSVYLQDARRLFLYRGPQATEIYQYSGTLWQDGFIAVPTHDFNGAWIMDRGTGKPSVLSHHTHAQGLREMWRDVAAPEVEALIAGNSGQTVLIQVHRDRSVALQQPFIDPALAVWRVGDPAPREYDELYLNEELNKGFVHVDPDTVAGGDPFVFDSGSFEEAGAPEEGPVSPPIGGGGDVIQEWGVVRASLKQRLVLPGVARLPGAFNSNWLTDVTIYNPLDTPQQVEVQYVPLGEAVQAESVRKITLTLNPFEIRFVPDSLQALFLIETGGGALHFLPATAINVVGRTYSSKDGGTFGFGMQAIDAMNATGPNFPVTFAGAFPGDRFRTNILLTDTSGRGTEIGLNAYGVTGALGDPNRTISAPANGIIQLNGLGSTMGLFGRDSAGLIIRPTRGTAIATVVAIDNRTNDPTYFPPDLTATIARAIPVIGHVDGAHGAHFRSDLYLFNPSRQTQTVLLDAKQWDSPTRVNRQFTLLPNEARVIPDALVTLFGMTGLARLQYSSPEEGDGVRVTSRTYTREESGATYGSLIPPLNNFQIATTGDALEILGAGGGAGFRTNLGLVELAPQQFGQPVRVRVRIIGSERKTNDSFIVEVPRSGGMQIGDIFTARGITAPAAALLVVEVLDQGLIGAYATLTDNKTNDTTYLGAQLAGKEE
ncbi:MAG TPA: hypothetical protein VEK57_25320 [Thermoanaerobaculia bacterium]|nr:hypothetical protein [Thermoanaerobaculia bacterium]